MHRWTINNQRRGPIARQECDSVIVNLAWKVWSAHSRRSSACTSRCLFQQLYAVASHWQQVLNLSIGGRYPSWSRLRLLLRSYPARQRGLSDSASASRICWHSHRDNARESTLVALGRTVRHGWNGMTEARVAASVHVERYTRCRWLGPASVSLGTVPTEER